MPSNRDPVAVVQPGPGRLPANTVPANALIFPPGGSSDAALQAHITDPVDAHMASAIGQTGYAAVNATWVQAAAGVGGTQNALNTLFDAANARPVWVLDANPAEKGDFVGPNALINAMAAVSTHQPVLYLRPGTYTWNDAVDFSNCTVVGARRNDVVIQNLAGDLRTGSRGRFQHLIIRLSGNLVVGAFGQSILREVTFEVSGNVNITSDRNVFEHLQVSTPTKFVISGNNNEVSDFTDSQFDISGTNNIVHHGSVTAVKSLTDSVARLSNASNFVSNISVSGIANYNTDCFLVTGGFTDYCVLDNLSISGFTTPGVNCRGLNVASGGFARINSFQMLNVSGLTNNAILLSGARCVLKEITLVGFPSFNATLVLINGFGNHIERLEATSFGTPGASIKLLSIDAKGNSVENAVLGVLHVPSTGVLVELLPSSSTCSLRNINVTSLTTPAGKLVVVDGTNNAVEGIVLNLTGDMQAGLEMVKVLGNNNKVSQVVFSSVPSNTGGATAALLTLAGTNMEVDSVNFSSLGTTSALTVPMLSIAGGSGLIQNVVADGNSSTINTGNFIQLDSVSPLEPLTFKSCVGYIEANSTANAFHASGIIEIPVVIEDCDFTARGAGSISTSATVFVQNCSEFVFRNVLVGSTHGHAGAFPNTGALLDRVFFSGSNGNPGAGLQLFYGYGRGTAPLIAPLILRDCEMEYGSSNCNAAAGTGTGEPVIFFGGSAGVVAANHGAIQIDGLFVHPGSSVTAQHRDSLMVIDGTASASFSGPTSSYRNITIDLKEIPWAQDGAARDTLPWTGNTTAAVLEIQGTGDLFLTAGLSSRAPTVQDFRIVNIKEQSTAIDDLRIIVKSLGVSFDGLVIDGPSITGVHGTKNFITAFVHMDRTWMKGLRLFPTTPLRTNIILGFPMVNVGGDGVVAQSRACKLEDFILNIPALGGSFTQFVAGSFITLSHASHIVQNGFIQCNVAAGVHISNAFILLNAGADFSTVKDVSIGSFQHATVIWSNASECTIDNNIIVVDFAGSVIPVLGDAVIGIRADGPFNKVTKNALYNFNASGGIIITAANNGVLLDGNTIAYTWATAAAIISQAIKVTGSFGRVVNNFGYNVQGVLVGPATGSVAIFVAGAGTTVSNNQLLGANGFNTVQIDTSTGSFSVILGNVIANSDAGGVGVINVAGTDLPAAPAGFNILT